jgi:hypothetical protein
VGEDAVANSRGDRRDFILVLLQLLGGSSGGFLDDSCRAVSACSAISELACSFLMYLGVLLWLFATLAHLACGQLQVFFVRNIQL